MASTADIRKRIRSVRSSQKITRAMKLVAASKLKRAQEAMTHARPYALEMGALLKRLAVRAGGDGEQAAHPLLELRAPRRVLLVVMTSDRGLCGAFNSSILRAADRFIRENRERFEYLEVATIGRKGRDHFKKRNVATVRDYPGVFDKLSARRATEIAEGLAKEFVGRELDAVYLVYNEFKSAISQRVVVQDLLPIVAEELPNNSSSASNNSAGSSRAEVDYLYEPSKAEVLEKLVPRYVSTLVWRALLESTASEHGARMAAMDSATKNAKELIEVLTLQYNRVRQAAITRELMEIIGGVEAMKA